ncbi:MAG: hypothetical protein ACE5Z5_03525 [Candidatus Bathyarchaeia archaeon]
MGRVKVLSLFALLGFVIGSVGYFVLSWIADHSIFIVSVSAVPLLDILTAPWFLSGLAGSALSVIIVTTVAHFTPEQ